MLNIYQFNYVFIVVFNFESNRPEMSNKTTWKLADITEKKKILIKGKFYSNLRCYKLRGYAHFLQSNTIACHVPLNYKMILDIGLFQHQYDNNCICFLQNNPHSHLRKASLC